MNERTRLTPNAQERVNSARELAREKLAAWGPMRVMHGSALILAILAAILPLASVTQFGLFGSSSLRMHFYDLGIGGWFVIILAVALAGAPFVVTFARRIAALGFGIASGGLGALMVPLGLATYTSIIAQLSIGYYVLFAAFALLVYAYWRRMDVFQSSTEASMTLSIGENL